MFRVIPGPSSALTTNEDAVQSRSLMQPEEVTAILDIIPEKGIVLEIGTFHGVTASLGHR